jgi:hypothetical protein
MSFRIAKNFEAAEFPRKRLIRQQNMKSAEYGKRPLVEREVICSAAKARRRF